MESCVVVVVSSGLRVFGWAFARFAVVVVFVVVRHVSAVLSLLVLLFGPSSMWQSWQSAVLGSSRTLVVVAFAGIDLLGVLCLSTRSTSLHKRNLALSGLGWRSCCICALLVLLCIEPVVILLHLLLYLRHQ